ncbi:phosphoenolpyruvate carboxylase [Fodinibius sp.]|uniref:phosphoenolpyruvate carboxylase n=1 Tax=Fodinibius sp. TaxID=1872440 RepID=UPI002ACE1F74|nr:phosphoenolpyruvate carboxylase [Fodinibius sp.]MDZ7660080.1 phosphoenolpyruvate carboxylase [Fodinibius sp.]
MIAEAWRTEPKCRQTRPSPQDEARWGFAGGGVVSLRDALPALTREVDAYALAERGLDPLALDAAPVRFATWMGGDRDGNPNVTAAVTREVLMLGRWMAADLFLRDVEALRSSPSMRRCSAELAERVGETGRTRPAPCSSRCATGLLRARSGPPPCIPTRPARRMPSI